MATELDINARISTADSAKSLGELRRGLKDLVSLQGEVGAGTAEFAKLRNAINETEGRIGDLTDSFSTLRGSGVERLGGSFSVLREGFEKFDTGKIKIGLQGIGSAMSAIPVFLIAEGIKLLIENFDEIVKFFKEAIGAASGLESELTKLKKTNEQLIPSLKNQITALEGLRSNDEKILELKKKIREQQIAEAKLGLAIAIQKEQAALRELNNVSLLEQLSGTAGAAQIKRAAEFKQAQEDRKKSILELQTLFAEGIKEENTIEQKRIDDNKKRREEKAAADKKAHEDDEKAFQEHLKRLDKLAEEAARKRLEQEKSFREGLTEIAKKQEGDSRQREIDGFLQELNDENNKNAERKALNQITFEDALSQIQQNKQRELENVDLTEQQRVEIIRRASQQELALRKQVEDAKFAFAQSTIKGISTLGEIFIQDAQKAQRFNKAIALAQIAVDTAKAISALTAASSANPANAATFGAAGAAQFAAGIVQILANIAQAKKILTSGGTPQVSGGGGSGGGGGIGGGAATPAPAQIPNFGGTNLPDSANQPQTIKVAVTETDITKTQNKVKVIENLAKIS